MNLTERATRTPSFRAALSATLLRGSKTGAPRTIFPLSSLLTIMTAFALTATPAIAAKNYMRIGSFGSNGGGSGEFREPAGIAVNGSTEPITQPAAGDVYVQDTNNARVERFRSDGAYVSQFDGSATPSGSFAFSGSASLAIDNSQTPLDPSAGDVYVQDSGHDVVDRFNATGEKYEGQLTGTCPAPGVCSASEVLPFTQLAGVAVDPSGDLWVYDNRGEEASIDEFDSTGGFLKTIPIAERVNISGLAAGATSVYALTAMESVVQFDSTTGERIGELAPGEDKANALAVDPSSGHLVVYYQHFTEGHIAIFEPDVAGQSTSNPLQSFPEEGISPDVHGIAVSADGVVYASHADTSGLLANQEIEIFKVPAVDTETASSIGETSATLNGSVNPEAEALTECYFEYGLEESYGQTTPCLGVPEGSGFVSVSAPITNLQPRSTYHFRVNTNGPQGIETGQDETLFTLAQPLIQGEAVPSRGSTVAQATAEINPSALTTRYFVEYGATGEYGAATGEVSAGAGSSATSVRVFLTGLNPGSTYHLRFVAINKLGTTFGTDLTFSTSSASVIASTGLPDGRAYELVSTANAQADVYPPIPTGMPEVYEERHGAPEIQSQLPFRASADGSRIAYVAEPPASGSGSGSQGDGIGNEYLGTRSSSGWTGADIYPLGTPLSAKYVAFSEDLAFGVLHGREAPPSSPCDEFQLRTEDDVLHPLFTEQLPVGCGNHTNNTFAGASKDFTHVLFESHAALVAGAEEATRFNGHNLYDSVMGHLQRVNVLPGVSQPEDPDAIFGGPHGSGDEVFNPPDFTNVISSDGKRISWTDLNTHHVYMRENGTTTIPVSAGPAEYWTATQDGRLIFYTEGEEAESTLWRFDVDKFEASTRPEPEALAEAREAVTGKEAGVLGVVGTNEVGEDGAYVYFVAAGVLAANENTNGETATSGEPNLYLTRGGGTTFLATLQALDNEVAATETGNGVRYGDWKRNLGTRTAEVTPSGHQVSFLSRAKLTSYDNAGCKLGNESVPCSEIYVYDSETGQISCASCDRSGAPAVANAQLPVSQTDRFSGGAYMERWLSDDGSRVFFDSLQPLVPQASNGRLNVYEWERDGSGSCHESSGCVYMLSGGSSSDDSFFIDASASGSDVFLTSRENLAAGARGELIKLYDVRVGGGFPESTTACSGTGCQGVPGAPPGFATPSSVSFNGAGNYVPSTKASAKSDVVAAARAAKLRTALQRCRKAHSHSRKKRKRCERSARKRYAAKKSHREAKS